MQKFDKHNIVWVGGQRATDYNIFCLNRTLINLYDAEGKITYGSSTEGYTIITPDQIDWGEEEKKGIYHTERSIVLREYMPLPYSGPKQSKTPAVFINAQKDWNGFKTFLKEIEAYGRTLTGSQLKAYMAKERKLRGGK